MGKLKCMTCKQSLLSYCIGPKMETENISDQSNNISVSIGLQNVMDSYGIDQKVIQYNRNIISETVATLSDHNIIFGTHIASYMISPGVFFIFSKF